MTARTMLLSDEEMIRESYGKHMVRHLYEAERNCLLDEIERLKVMVPKWVEVGSEAAGLMEDCGWRFHKLGATGLMLMVPPIPLPDKKEGE